MLITDNQVWIKDQNHFKINCKSKISKYSKNGTILIDYMTWKHYVCTSQNNRNIKTRTRTSTTTETANAGKIVHALGSIMGI